MVGVDKFLVKNGKIKKLKDEKKMSVMKLSVYNVVRVEVEKKKKDEMKKIVEGMKSLEKYDNMVKCIIEEYGEKIIDGDGELKLEICIKDLEEDND